MSSWYTKSQVSTILGVSEKTVERMIARGELHHEKRKRPGKGPVTVLDPEDVEKARQALADAAPSPAVIQNAEGSNLPARRMGNPIDALVEALAAAAPAKHPTVPIHERLYLSIPEAAALSGLPQSYIRAQAHAGNLHHAPAGRGLKVLREDVLKLR